MTDINEKELCCLRRLAQQPSKEISPCDNKVIKRLLAMHLIEEVPAIRLPLEMASSQYRVTHAGLSILHMHPR